MRARYTFLLRPLRDQGDTIEIETATVVANSERDARQKAEAMLSDDGKDVGALWQVSPAEQ